MSGNRCLILKSRPVGPVRAADFEIMEVTRPVPDKGQVLVKNNLLGADEGYLPPIAVGSCVKGTVLGRVLETRNDNFRVDDIIVGRGNLGQLSVITPDALCWKIDSSRLPSLAGVLSVFGNTGLTAYFGMLAVAQPRAGDTVLVSGAAGAVGSIAGQIARIKECRVVGLAGGQAQCSKIIEEFGFHEAIDYRGKSTIEIASSIAQACPDGVDIYFDNVGGSVLDAALMNMKLRGKIAACGMISQYDGFFAPQMRNLFYIISKCLKIEGFLLSEFMKAREEAELQLRRWVDGGEMVFREHIAHGIDAAIPTFIDLFNGHSPGKSLVRLDV